METCRWSTPVFKPGDAFYQYVNGAWLKATEIPADRSSMSDSAMLSEQADRRTREIIQETAQDKNATADAKKIADFYNAFMDEAQIEKLGLGPLEPQLRAIAAIRDRKSLSRLLGSQLRADVDVLNNTDLDTDKLLGLWVAQDLDDPSRYAPFLLQGGLGMPDRDYYLDDSPATAAIRAKYTPHLAKVLGLAGIKDADAKAGAHFRAGKAHGDRAQHARRIVRRGEGEQPLVTQGLRRQGAGAGLAGIFRSRGTRRTERIHRVATRRGHRACRRWLRVSRSRPGRTT